MKAFLADARSRRIVDRARQIVGPVPLEEGPLVPVSSADGPDLAGEAVAFHTHTDLLGPVLVALGDEADVRNRARSGLRDTAPLVRADCPCATASPAAFEIEVERLQDGFGSDRALTPLQSAQ